MMTNEKESTQKSAHPDPELDEETELGGHMTFLEHLVELRERLIKILVGVAVAVVICFSFSDQLIYFLLNPIPREVLEEKVALQLEKTKTVPADATGTVTPAPADLKTAPLPDMVKIITTTPVQGIIVLMKASVVAGIFLSFPWIFYQIWMFVSPGLYHREKRVIFPVIFASWGCFILGGAFCYFVVFRYALLFLIRITPGILEQYWIISDYMDFMLRVLLAFGIIFEEPVVIYILGQFGIVDSKMLSKFRPYAIVTMFVIAAIITPPDVITQVSCAVPLVILYEVSLLLVKNIERRRATAAAT